MQQVFNASLKVYLHAKMHNHVQIEECCFSVWFNKLPFNTKHFWQGSNFYIWTEQKCIWKHWPVLHCTLSHWSCEGWRTSRVAYLRTPNSTKDKCSLWVFENDKYLESSEFLPFHHFNNKSFTLCSANFPESKVCAISYYSVFLLWVLGWFMMVSYLL